MKYSRLNFSSELTSWRWWLAEVNEMLPRCFLDVFPWLKHWLSDYMRHEMFSHVNSRSKEEGMIEFTRSSLRLRHGNRSWSRPLESMLVLGLYQHVSEPYQKRLCKALIQRSVMPRQRMSKCHLLFEFTENIKKYWIHAYWTKRPVSKRFGLNTCTVTPC